MEEQKFIKLLKEGKQSAFNRLLDDYQQKVFSTCISFVPNKEDAEDIAQEVFLEIFKSISRFKGDSKLSTWIYRIATNKCLEFIRKKNTKKRFAFMQSILGNEIALDKTTYFTEFNHPGIVLENKEKLVSLVVEKSTIGSDFTIEGLVNSAGDVDLGGSVKGPVNVKALLIKEKGSVIGEINAERVDVFGYVDGKVTAKKIVIGTTGEIKGDLSFTENLRVDDGAKIGRAHV